MNIRLPIHPSIDMNPAVIQRCLSGPFYQWTALQKNNKVLATRQRSGHRLSWRSRMRHYTNQPSTCWLLQLHFYLATSVPAQLSNCHSACLVNSDCNLNDPPSFNSSKLNVTTLATGL